MTVLLVRLLVLLALLCAGPPAAAQDGAASPGDLQAALDRLQAAGAAPTDRLRTANTTTRLVADVATAVPGTTVTLAFVQDIRDGWHTYWRNPGDSGAPATLAWTLPPAVAIGPSQWPAPEAIPYFGLMTFGHHDRLVLLHDLTIPAGWPSGAPLAVRLEAEWLVCAEICIPEHGSLALELATGATPVPADAATRELVETARAALPGPSPWRLGFNGDAATLRLALTTELGLDRVQAARFFPAAPGLIENVAAPVWRRGPDGFVLEHPRPATAGPLPGIVAGVLVLTEALPDGPQRRAFVVEAAFDPAIGGAAAGRPGLVAAVLLAFAGGLLLNLMPCVFPVLSLKALALVHHAGGPRALAHGVAYTLGVLVTFLALAGLLVALRAGGAFVGWGFQLQEPLVVALLAYLVFAIGLWLIGGLELAGTGRLMGLGQSLAPRDGLAGSFATGVLAVVVASPCTAPFMAGAIGFGLTQPPATTLAVFAALGLGLAAPFLALGCSPALQRALPRPGPWLLRFRQLMAFPMFATAAWLAWVLAQQAGDRALLLVLLGFVALGLAAWALRLGGRLPRAVAMAGLAVALGLAALPGRLPAVGTVAGTAGSGAPAGPAEPFSPERLAELQAQGRPVFVDMTAAWCLTCLVNEQAALAGPAFEAALERHGIAYLQGDWTRQDPLITRFLARFGRAGVPLYVLFPTHGEPIVLPQLLTPGIIAAAFAAADDSAGL